MVDSWDPKLYGKFKDERSQPFFDLLALVQAVPEAEIVDLGCGPGELTRILSERFSARFTLGLDSSPEMLKKASALSVPGRLEFQAGDIEDWSPAQKYDVIFSNAALHWCLDHPVLLRKFRAALKDGGQLAIQIPVNHDYPTHTVALRMASEKHWIQKLGGGLQDFAAAILSPSDYASELYHLGFREQNVHVRVYGHVLGERKDVIEWVKGTTLTRFQARLSAEDYRLFLEEYQIRLFAELKDEKPFFYPFKRLFLYGRL